MRRVRIVLFDFDTGRANKGTIRAGLIRQRNIKVVHAHENAVDRRPRKRSHCDCDGLSGTRGHAATESHGLRENNFQLQNWRIIFPGDAGQVAGCRVTAAALATAIEVDLAGFGVAREELKTLLYGPVRSVSPTF